jgi:hypothetical protein
MSRPARKKEEEEKREKKDPSLFLQLSPQQSLGVLIPKPYAP